MTDRLFHQHFLLLARLASAIWSSWRRCDIPASAGGN